MRIFILCAILALPYCTVQAQKGNSFILGYIPLYQTGYGDAFYADNVISSYNATSATKGRNHAGLVWVKANKSNSANRFGIQFFGKGFRKPLYHYSNFADTFIHIQNEYLLMLPRIMLGREYQKLLHESVIIIGGMDIGFGGMYNRKELYTSEHFGPTGVTTIVPDGRVWMFTFSARTFTGIRIAWARFATGFEVSIPLNYSLVAGENIHDLEGLTLNYHLNLGYRFFSGVRHD